MCACIHVRRREDGEKLSKVLLFQQHGGFMCWHQHIFHFIFQPKFLWLFAHIHAFTWCHYRIERMAWQEKTTSSRDETIAKTERKSLCTNVIESLQWGRWRQAQQQREEKNFTKTSADAKYFYFCYCSIVWIYDDMVVSI